MPPIWRLLTIGASALVLLALFFAARNFYRATDLRYYPVKVIATQLRVEAITDTSTGRIEPEYNLILDFLSQDGSQRTFHWEGDAGEARYPEEAFDVYDFYKPGSTHTIASPRGKPRDVRLDALSMSPEISNGIGWCFLAGFFSAFAFAFYLCSQESRLRKGTWMVLVFFGLFPLFGSIPLAYTSVKKMLTWQPVELTRLGDNALFNPANAPPGVQFSPQAITLFSDKPYSRYSYQLDGRTYHLGQGSFYGAYDGANYARYGKAIIIHVNPRNPWDIDGKLTWAESVFLPTGIVLLFGIVFTGAGLLVRRFESRL